MKQNRDSRKCTLTISYLTSGKSVKTCFSSVEKKSICTTYELWRKGGIGYAEKDKEHKTEREHYLPEGIPERVLQELSEEQQKQYFIWDELIKRLAQLYPPLLLPLIKEIFHKEYPEDASIEFLSSEYVYYK